MRDAGRAVHDLSLLQYKQFFLALGREVLPVHFALDHVHIAIQEELNGKVVDWMEKVTDEQYQGPRDEQ
jgi:hypothetical protein